MSTFDDIFGDSSNLMSAPSVGSTNAAASSSVSLEGLGLDDLDLGKTAKDSSSAPAPSSSSDPSDFLDWLDQKPTPPSVLTSSAPADTNASAATTATSAASIDDMFTLDETPVKVPEKKETPPLGNPGNPFASSPINPAEEQTLSSPAPVAPAPAKVLNAEASDFAAPPPMPIASNTKQVSPPNSNSKAATTPLPHSNTNSNTNASPYTSTKSPSPPPTNATNEVAQSNYASTGSTGANKAPTPPHTNPGVQASFSSNPRPPTPPNSSTNPPTPPQSQAPTSPTNASPYSSNSRTEPEPVIEIKGGSRHNSFEAFTKPPSVVTAEPSATTPPKASNDNLRYKYRQMNKIPPAERLEAWTLLLEAKGLDPQAFVSSVSSSEDIKKDAETICSALFSDSTFINQLKKEGVPIDATRLSMTENVEQVLRALCGHHSIPYTPKLGNLYTPLFALSSGDPLRQDIFGLVEAVTVRLVPSVLAQVSNQSIANARRPLMKLLLLYHDPAIALHLDHTLPQWNDSSSGVLPDSWLSSLFEGSDHTNTMPLPALSNIWDCCIVNASSTYPSIIGLFIVLHAILQSKKRLLSLTNSTTLRTVMMQLLVETLSQSPQLLQNVHELIEKTPFSFCTKLCDAGLETPVPEKPASRSNSSSSITSPRTSSKDHLETTTSPSMSKFGASLSSMNSKFFAGASKLTASITGKSEADKPASRSESFHLEAAAVYFSMTISACEVIPSVFRGFKSASTEKIRYFIVDCRPEEYQSRGRIPTSFSFNSESLLDPSAFESVMATLQPMKSSVHICILGHGYARHANHMVKDLNMPKSLVADLLAKDAAQINDAVMFLAKRGFPYVSVVEGGFASTHRFLSKSRLFTLSDLTDHDPAQCDLCQQDAALKNKGRISSSHSDEEDEYIQRTEGGVCLGRFGPDGRKKNPAQPGARQSVTSPSTASSYFSSMTNVLKDSTKTMAAVSSKTLKAVPGSDKMTDALKDSKNWMLKKTESMHLNEVSHSMTSGMKSVVDVAANPASMLKKAANSFANTLGNAEPPMMPPPAHSPSAASQQPAATATAVKKPAAPTKAKEAVFSIDDDDDDEEPDSFLGSSEPNEEGEGAQHAAPTVVVHAVRKGAINELRKGMQIRTPELLPLVSSPLFSCYKKKTRGTDTLMLPRHVVIAEGHIIVLKADKVQEDTSYVRSCHHLSHISRMTCMKKNALMVTLYLSFDSKQKQKQYEVQQRDAFIKVVRTSMEELAAQKEDEEA